MGITEAATAWCQSYAKAMHMGQDPKATKEACGQALASLYLPGFTAFTGGNRQVMEDRSMQEAGCISHLERFEKSGMGWDVRLIDLRIDPVSQRSACCWMTWEIHPKNEVKSWKWENMYGYRSSPAGEGFELVIADNEFGSLLENCPTFFSDLTDKSTGSS